MIGLEMGMGPSFGQCKRERNSFFVSALLPALEVVKYENNGWSHGDHLVTINGSLELQC